MLGRLRRTCQPALARQTTLPALVATTRSKALHTNLYVEAEEQLQDSTDPYLYTTGRWLNRDKLQREARYLKFDFAALCKKVVNTCPGATKVIRYEKKEGGFNRVFILYLDNGESVVARIPFRIAGPRRLVTNSEVATMAYARSFTKIPVPRVLDWSDNNNNSIGTEYIIMEHVHGVQLHNKWPDMNPHQHMLCAKKVAFIMAEMAKLPFPARVLHRASLEKLMSSPEDSTSNAAASEETVVETPQEEAARKRHEKDVWTCRQTFEVVLKGYAPKLYTSRAMEQTLLRPFRYCDASWRDSAAALRQDLIELSQNWTDLGLPGSCPYEPTPEELAMHAKQYEDFESVQQLKMFLRRALDADPDGWVPAENWETAKKEHRILFTQWMDSTRESGSSEGHARKLWPFDEV